MRHGTRTAYAEGCRCDGCRLTQVLYRSEPPRKRVIPTYKPEKLIPAGKSKRLAKILYEGRSLKEVAALSGLSHTAVRLLIIGATTHVYPETEKRLIAAIAEAAMVS